MNYKEVMFPLSKLILLCLLSMIVGPSCQIPSAVSQSEVVTIPTVAPTPIATSPQKLDPAYKDTIYSVLFSDIHRTHLDDDLPFDSFGPRDWLVYGKQTITPFGTEQLASEVEIPPSLLVNLAKANQKAEILRDEYDVKAPVGGNLSGGDLEKFFNTSRRKYKDTKAVINLSNIGIDDSHNNALVYVEYYSPEKKTLRGYFQFWLDRYKPDTEHDSFTGSSRFKFYLLR